MKKSLILGVVALQLLYASSTFAAYKYTIQDTGFMVQYDKKPDYVVVGRDFFSAGDLSDAFSKDYYSYSVDELKDLSGVEFSTKLFKQYYQEIELLQRNHIAPKKAKHPLLKPQFFVNKPMPFYMDVDFSTLDYDVKAERLYNQPAITISFHVEDEVISMNLFSANDRLYVVRSNQINNLKKINSVLNTSSGKKVSVPEAEQKNDAGEDREAAPATEQKTVEPSAELQKIRFSRVDSDDYAKPFVYQETQKHSKIELPNDWFYVESELLDEYKLNIAFAVSKPKLDKALQQMNREEILKKLEAKPLDPFAAIIAGVEAFNHLEELLIIGSIQTDEFAKGGYLTDLEASAQEISKEIDSLKVMCEKPENRSYGILDKLDYKIDFDQNKKYGVLRADSIFKILNSVIYPTREQKLTSLDDYQTYNCSVKLAIDEKGGSFAGYLSLNGEPISKKLADQVSHQN